MLGQKFTYRNPKILAHANGQPCCNCGIQDGTVVSAHSNSHWHGKGRGIKSHDIFVAFLCHMCHTWLDSESSSVFDTINGKDNDPTNRYCSSQTEKMEMWQRAHALTLIILLRDGIIK